MGLKEYSQELVELYTRAGQSVVGIAGGHFSTSGLAWAPQLVFTAEHTLGRGSEFQVTTFDGRSVNARVLGRDSGVDLALLETEEELGVPFLERADSTPVGALVFGLARSPQDGLGATLGVLSASSGEWRTGRGGRLDSFLQPDVSLYAGYSGGPLVDVEGKLIGLNTDGLTRHGTVTLGLDTLDRVAEELQAPPRERGYLGVGLHSVHLSEEKGGAIVISLEPDSPAHRSGVLLGDILTELGSQSVHGVEDASVALDQLTPGEPIESSWIRGGALVALTLTPGSRPCRCG